MWQPIGCSVSKSPFRAEPRRTSVRLQPSGSCGSPSREPPRCAHTRADCLRATTIFSISFRPTRAATRSARRGQDHGSLGGATDQRVHHEKSSQCFASGTGSAAPLVPTNFSKNRSSVSETESGTWPPLLIRVRNAATTKTTCRHAAPIEPLACGDCARWLPSFDREAMGRASTVQLQSGEVRATDLAGASIERGFF